MGTTNSTKHSLNYYTFDATDNSGVSTYIVTNTGNRDRKNGLPVLNDTYTLSTASTMASPADINVILSNWNDGMGAKGAELAQSPGIFNNVQLEADKTYVVYGHPDKFVYDYQQDYQNCGVDSCLNILAMAGKKDIIEVNSSYQQYLSTPIVKKVNKVVWDSESGTWKSETVEETTYPKAQTETEDEFLLWAVQNSPNDSAFYDYIYENKVPIDSDIPDIYTDEINDYVVHSKNNDKYITIEDIQATPAEIGGTRVEHRDNILNYWGVESTIKRVEISLIKNKSAEEQAEQLVEQTVVDNGDGTSTRTTITTSTDEKGRRTTTKTLVEVIYNKEEGDTTTEEKLLKKTEIVEETTSENTKFYSFINTIAKDVMDGKGIILGGYANAFKGEKGGGHALSVVGVVTDTSKVIGTKTTTVTNQDGTSLEPDVENIYGQDIIGVYVIDTGGFLGGGTTEKAQFLDIGTLYNFLTDSTYLNPGAEDQDLAIEYNCTVEEIRSWADNMNIVGNDRKNILGGNRAQNYIWGGGSNDILYGDAGDDYLFGEDDNDTLYGGQGNDVLDGGKGKDIYVFGNTLYGSDLMEDVDGSHDLIIARNDKDTIQFDSSSLTSVTPIEDMYYQNKNGNLVIEYEIKSNDANNTNTITVKDYFSKSLYNSIATIRETMQSVSGTYDIRNEFNFVQEILSRGYIDYFAYAEKNNTLKGSKFMDSIIGGNRNDVITGGNGSDIINGGASDDTIKAGNDNDTIWGSYGNDKIYGEKGDDVIRYQKELPTGASEDYTEKFAGGAYGGHDTIYSGSGYDVIELLDFTRNQLTFTRANKDLVITYDKTKGGSITIANYFSKKGNTSIKELKLANGADAIGLYGEYAWIESQTLNVTGTDGYDKITGSAGDDTLLSGGLGNDTIYGGAGNDILNGGLGSDKLYGQAGDNTYIFDSKALGEDTIYTSGNGKTILDFTGSGVTFTSKGSNDAINEYSFTKVKNDLIINYATEADYSDSDNSLIRITNYFKSKGNFEIINTDGTKLDLKTQTVVYMNGDDEKKNKITGSNYNDFIVAYDYNDTLKGGKGDDLLIGGKGNDNLTGGAGNNTIQYTKGDGLDTINLTKGENLKIELSDFATNAEFDYEIVKKDLVISYVDNKGKKEQLLVLKNFGSKDVTGAAGSVKLYNNGTEVMDLRLGDYLDDVIYFTSKKYSYNGKWQSEVIDTRALNEETPSKNRGAKVNAGAGNDTIWGSDYNDTLNGGDGDDVIYSSYGTNKVDGGKGSDTYHLFEDDSNANLREYTIVKDTGKDGAEDTAQIHASLADITTTKGNYATEQGRIWFNIKQNGTYTATFNVEDANGNKATISGVEKIVVGDETKTYQYNYEQLVSDVVTWLTSKGYKDVSQALNSNVPSLENELLAIFTKNDYFTEIV